MTRKEFVCAAVLKYLERPEIMDIATNVFAKREELEKLTEAVLQFARCYTVIENCCERAAEEFEYKLRAFKEAHKHDFD